MKKKLSLALCLVLLVSALTGCYCTTADFTLNLDGSGTCTMFMGFTAETWNYLQASGDAEVTDVKPEVTIVKNGTQYLGEQETTSFANIGEFNTQYGDALWLTRAGDSYTLFVWNTDFDFDTDETLSMATTGDTQFEPEPVIEFSFVFPYDVTMTVGSADGVTIDRNHMTLDCLSMTGEDHIFYIGPQQKFTDVEADAWYYSAVIYGKGVGVVNGYPDGSFGPNNTLLLDQLCQVLYNVGGEKGPNDNPYWAYVAIKDCIDKGFISAREGDITAATYAVPVTREEAVAAVTRAYEYYDYPDQVVSDYVIPDAGYISDMYYNDIFNAYSYGIVAGVDGAGTFNPAGELTRAELCQVFYNLKWTPATVG